MLSADGKKKLAKDILREASVPFGGGHEEEPVEEEEDPPKKKKKTGKKAPPPPEYPVVGVHFSSFIVQ
jgi:flagellar FliL protein